MFVINHKKIFFSVSAILVAASIIAILALGFNTGIDFAGGTVTEVRYTETVADPESVRAEVGLLGLGNFRLESVGDDSLVVETRVLTSPEHEALLETLTLGNKHPLIETRLASIGPTVGGELRSKAITSLIIVAIIIILFIAWAFRKSSKHISSWRMGLVAILTLLHDVIIPTGIFVVLGSMFIGLQIDTLFVTALLAILGYSVNDTIVVFDRVRENLANKSNKETFEEVVGRSLNQTVRRSINTSVTTLLVLLSILFLGPASVTGFVLVLAIGVIVGTYSSIFLAAPLLVSLHKQ